MRTRSTFVCAAFLLLVAAELDAQRRPRRFTRPEGEASPPAPREEAAPPTEKPVERWTAIEGGDVHLGDGTILRRATVLVGDARIHAVGHELEIPDGATRIDATGKVVAPGFCIVKAGGLGAPSGFAVESIKDSVNPFDPEMKLGLAAGITSFLALYDGGSTTPKGNSALVKLSFGDLDGMVAVDNPVVSMRVPLDPQAMRELRKLVRETHEHKKKASAAPAPRGGETPRGEAGGEARGGDGRGGDGSRGGDASRPPRGSEVWRDIIDGKKRLWVTGTGDFDTPQIRQALEIAELLGVGVVLEDPVTAWVVADEIAATGSMVILSPRTRVRPDPGRPDETGTNFAAAAILADAGVPVAVTTPSGRASRSPGLGTGGILGQDLNTPTVDAAYAVRGGLDNRKALRTLTLDSAKIVGAEARVGSISAGKDADLLILDGDPLHYKTFVELALVNGKVVYDKAREPFYRHVGR